MYVHTYFTPSRHSWLKQNVIFSLQTCKRANILSVESKIENLVAFSPPLGPIADISDSTDSEFIRATNIVPFCGFLLGSHVRQRTDIISGNLLVLPLSGWNCSNKGGLRCWASEQAAVSTEISVQQEYRSNGTSRKAYLAFILRLPGVTLLMWVTVIPLSSAARLTAAVNKKTDCTCTLTVWSPHSLYSTSSCLD